jgi:chromosome segregation ATPase
MLTAEDVVRLFEADARARRRLAELLVSEPDVRLAVINAVLRDVATKSDLEALRREVRESVEAVRSEVLARVSALESRVSELSERVARLEGAFTQLAERIGDLDKRIDALDKRIDALDRRIDGLDKRIDALDKRIDGLERRMDYVVRVSWVLVASVLATLLAQLALALLHALGKM